MAKTNVFINGLEVEAHYDYDKGWPGSLEEPPEPERAEVYQIWIEGVDMSQYLTDEFEHLVEEAILEQIHD